MDIFTPPTSPPPDKQNGGPWPIAMPVAHRAMDSFSHVVPQLDVQPRNLQNGDSGRVLILCFDGTGNTLGEVGVNVCFQCPSMPNLFTESMGI